MRNLEYRSKGGYGSSTLQMGVEARGESYVLSLECLPLDEEPTRGEGGRWSQVSISTSQGGAFYYAFYVQDRH